ncbi:hypothetical protein M0802_005185 [Mischocyttarus mexicanus]|nr:hypothetical protein M0802_005185 [Mischocyttarus mexicanus]
MENEGGEREMGYTGVGSFSRRMWWPMMAMLLVVLLLVVLLVVVGGRVLVVVKLMVVVMVATVYETELAETGVEHVEEKEREGRRETACHSFAGYCRRVCRRW